VKELKVAVIGPNAKAPVLSGGGSAALTPSYFVTPFDGIANALKEAGNEIKPTYSEGIQPYKLMPVLDQDILHGQNEHGWIGKWYTFDDEKDNLDPYDKEKLELLDQRTPIQTDVINESYMFIQTTVPKGITRKWTLKVQGYLAPQTYDRKFEFGLVVAGRGQVFVDGEEVIHNWERQRPGSLFFGQGTQEEKGIFEMKANTKHEITVVFCNVQGRSDGNENEAIMDVLAGLRIGGAEVRVPAELLQEAVDLAKAADVVIVVVGLNGDWEAEGYDRQTLALPKGADRVVGDKVIKAIGTDEFVEAVSKANRKTIVVTQGGSAITMPWAYSHSHRHSPPVPAIVHAWYLGNATGDAIADVLFGKHNPSGKLPITFPKNERQIPSYGNFRTENGKVRYAEDLFVGYKHYHLREITPLFAFGHGLSYTTFALSNLQLSPAVVKDREFELTVSLTITNTGDVTGSEVIQVYTTLASASKLTHPILQLKGFTKVHDLAAGDKKDVQVVLDKYAISYWNEVTDVWAVEKGVYKVAVGSSIQSLPLEDEFEVKEAFEWNGL
jgi:beta-glucosidase